ncbi:MAG: DsbA family protein, partial [Actinobacteria bacterium]|nr:DsbA family protein [Actinomycetota bacterium]
DDLRVVLDDGFVALQAGAPWDVHFAPFSLNQVHVAEGERDVWDDPGQAANLRAMTVGIVVRDRFPADFLRVHLALFTARHDQSRDVRDDDVLRTVLTEQGVNADMVFAEIEDGWPLETFRKEHEELVHNDQAFGVPTFIAEGQAVFVRLMHRPDGDADTARGTIERVLDLVTGWPELNEFKHTSIPR